MLPVFRKLGAGALVLLILFLLALGFAESRCLPVLCTLARTQAENTASMIISDVISREIQGSSLSYWEMIRLEKDRDGKITALKTNMQQVNQLKSLILSEVNRELTSQDPVQLGIPVGNLLFPELFGGMGPAIPVRILALRSCRAEFISDFTQAGINQTLHKLHMKVYVDGTILVLGNVLSFSASGDVSVAETVIVGSVPDSYS